MNAIWSSVKVYGLMVVPGGGGDTSTLHVVIKAVWTVCTQGGLDTKTLFWMHLCLYAFYAKHAFVPLCAPLFLLKGGGNTNT